MSIEKLQAKINAQADEKLMDFIEKRLNAARYAATDLVDSYKDANLSKKYPNVFVKVVTMQDERGNPIVRVDGSFFDALKQALFDAAVDCARQMETDKFFETIEAKGA